MPNKLFEMSFSDIPIFSNRLVEIDEFLKELKNGKTIDFEEKNAILYNLTMFLNNRKDYLLTNDKKKVLEAKYSWTAQEEKLLNIYNKLLKER